MPTSVGSRRSHALRLASCGDANYERLVALKAKYDPQNLFRLDQNVRPEGA